MKTCVNCQDKFENLMPGDRCVKCFETWTNKRPDKLTKKYWDSLTDEQKWVEISNTFHTGMLIAMAYKTEKEVRLTMKDDIAELIRENTEVREENTAFREKIKELEDDIEPGPHKIIPVPGQEEFGMCEICDAAEGELTTECPGRKTSYLERQAVLQGQGDFKNGRWISKL